MGDSLLGVFHSSFDSQGNEGCLSLYYSNFIPVISFSKYYPENNNDLQLFPFSTISSIFIEAEREGNLLKIFVKGQLISASIFRLKSKFDLLSFIQIAVSNGILNSDNSNKWIPVLNQSCKPKDSIQWIYDNSPNLLNRDFSLSNLLFNSKPPYNENFSENAFSISKHNEIMRDLIEKGKKTDIYQKLNQLSLKEQFFQNYNNSNEKEINETCKLNQKNETVNNETDNENENRSNETGNLNQNNETGNLNQNNKNQNNETDGLNQNNETDNENKLNANLSNEHKTIEESKIASSESNEIITSSFLSESFRSPKLLEYLTVRRQWESRISHQNFNNSKHNNDVEKVLKDLPRTISNERTIVLLYNVLRTTITYCSDIGFSQGMVDISYFIADVVLDDVEDVSDDSQSLVFWCLYSILFTFGQNKWFQAFEVSNKKLIETIDHVLSKIYPQVADFIRFNDFEVFKHCFGSILTMFTRMFSKNIEKKLWLLIFLKKEVDVFHAAIFSAIFCLNFPKLIGSKAIDMSHITELVNSNYIVENEDNFLALVASISDLIDSPENVQDDIDFSCSLFKPISF